MCLKAEGLDFFTSTATMFSRHLQNPWMCASLFQQSHQGAIVTMTKSVDESFVTNWWSPFAQMSLDPHQQVALAVTVQMVAELAVHINFTIIFHRCFVTGGRFPECPKLNASCLSTKNCFANV